MTTKLFSTRLSMPDSAGYLEQVGTAHRKRFGQFFTHPAVAKFMVRWALGSEGGSLYDPAFGLGAFLHAAVANRRVRFAASEIDPTVLRYWADATGSDASFIHNEDYLTIWGRKHDNIVCNPPYMRFQHFHNRDAVLNAFAENLGLQLSGYTNTASAFLLKSLSELRGTGRLAYIMPLEFLNTGYGKLVKAMLIADGHLAAIVSLDCERDVVPDAITSVGIVLYDAGTRHTTVDFHAISSLDALESVWNTHPAARVSVADLNPDAKWLSYFEQTDRTFETSGMVRLDCYGRFTRGIATGANEFFALRPSEASQWGLGRSECIPCITRSAQVRKAVFTPLDYDRLAGEDAPALLFSPFGDLSPGAARYIEYGEANGYHQRYITRHRSPWYKPESRDASPMLLGVFSRGDYKIIRNRSDAVSLSCYHGFRPNLHGLRYIDRLFLYLASSVGRKIVAQSMRKYGNALGKFEPNDANEARVPSHAVLDELTDDDARSALEYVSRAGSVPESVNLFFARLTSSPGKG